MLIIDSGVGGLSIAKEIHQHCPSIAINYLMDDGFFPYGTKSDSALQARLSSLCAQAIKLLSPKLIVIACNTASTLALENLRREFNLPFIGVVPAIKVASEQCTTRQFGLLATPATVKRDYIDNLIHRFAADCHVRRLGSDEMVRWAEEYLQGHEPQALFSHLDNWLHSPEPISDVVLGCTHFPLLKPLLQTHWQHINWIDSGFAIAQRVKTLSQGIHSANPHASLFYTGMQKPNPSIVQYLDNLQSVYQVRQLPIPTIN